MKDSTALASSWQAAGSNRTRSFARISVMIVTLIGFGALFAALLIDQRRQDWRQASVAAGNLDDSIRRAILLSFRTADQSLLSVREMIKVDPGFRFDEQKRRAFLGSAPNDTNLGEIYVLDAHGELTLASEQHPHDRTNFANEPFFFTHERTLEDKLFTSRTVTLSPLKETVVILSRRLSDARGRFAGVIVFSVNLAGFNEIFRSLDLGDQGAAGLYATDGTLLLRAPNIPNAIGKNYVATSMFWQLATAKTQFTSTSAIDNVDRLYSASHVGDLPLIAAVGLSVDEIYAGWRRVAMAAGIAFSVLVVCVAALSVTLWVELRNRRRSEQRYRTLAHVDGLTGLFNRRQFDATLEAEFDRATRLNAPLSLILIDIDRFKLFNDVYGHQSGDTCLKGVAGAIQAHLNRTGDVAARYGGEEIAIILPNTDEAGAEMIAERIRAAIEELAIAHSASDTGCVTASFGVATNLALAPDREITPAALVSAADEALYGAKRSGRNRVISHTTVQNGIPALPPANETLRIGVIENVLRDMPERARSNLDHISQLAAQSLGTSMAFVTLVETDSQQFLGQSGLAVAQLDRKASFCAHALCAPEPLIVLDAQRDIRFTGNPLVTGEPHLRFYAGAPLIDQESGATIGTLCIADQQPRASFPESQKTLLANFASLAMAQIIPMAPLSEPTANAGLVSQAH